MQITVKNKSTAVIQPPVHTEKCMTSVCFNAFCCSTVFVKICFTFAASQFTVTNYTVS